jgi:riboflavin synthase
MFTGLITAVGEVRRADRSAEGLELTIGAPYVDLTPGESVAVDGACLTVQALNDFGDYASGQRVNLERALRIGDRLGGHLVQGHVDGVGTVERVRQQDDARLVDLRLPDEVARISIPLGSITVDGVSLTVNSKPASGVIQISLIPFTLQHTTLGERRVGDRVHLEADAIGKYVAALLENRVSSRR